MACNEPQHLNNHISSIAPPNSAQTQFIYEPLDPSTDGIRLLILDSQHFDSLSGDSPISGQLIHVTFGDRPTYEALSYTWGDEIQLNSISINEKPFYVGNILYSALGKLRKRSVVLPLWIDAICINQNDVQEKNRQLQIMPHIYTRANNVLVWLQVSPPLRSRFVTKTSHSRAHFVQDNDTVVENIGANAVAQGFLADSSITHNIHNFNSFNDTASEETSEGLHTKVFNNDYWKRVWIIQEIGKARSIRVLFDDHDLIWEAFIEWVSLRRTVRLSRVHKNTKERYVKRIDFVNDGLNGPQRLDQQLRTKYTTGHTLRSLLETHQNAVCKDPHDKIYGLIGLATDCYGFPMDYDKSLFEVWKDTVAFAYEKEIVDNIASFGQLVQRLLGEEDQILQGLIETITGRTPLVFDEDDNGDLVEMLPTTRQNSPEPAIPSEASIGTFEHSLSSETSVETGSFLSKLISIPLFIRPPPPPQTPKEDHEVAPIQTFKPAPHAIRIPVKVIGMVSYRGPTAQQVVSSLHAVDEWTAEIRQRSEAENKFINKENDLFLETLERLNFSEKNLVSFGDSGIRWTTYGWAEAREDALSFRERRCIKRPVDDDGDVNEEALSLSPSLALESFRLFQFHPTEDDERAQQDEFHRLGIAPPGVQINDLICAINGIRNVIVVRPSPSGEVRMIGTAWLSSFLISPKDNVPSQYFSSPDHYSSEDLDLVVDLETAYIILSEKTVI